MNNIKICIHWTAGGGNPNEMDKAHYHFLVASNGIISQGYLPVSANLRDCSNLGNGQYVAHCGGGNSYAIGFALCGMTKKVKDSQGIHWQNPINKIQYDKAIDKLASLVKQYNIPISPDRIYTHYEFGRKHPKTSSAGKIDITELPFDKSIKPNSVGDKIRQDIANRLTR